MPTQTRIMPTFLKSLVISAMAIGLLAATVSAQAPPQGAPQSGAVSSPQDIPPPPPDYMPPPPPAETAKPTAPPPDYSKMPPPPDTAAQQATPAPPSGGPPLQPGEAYHTRFSGTVQQQGPNGPVTVIDLDGVVGSIIDLRNLGEPPRGQHVINEPQRAPATAADAGQVFGIAFDDAAAPNIFITATSAFGLHLAPGTKDWMTGMWGPDGGPGTIYRLSPETGYVPEFFVEVTLNGRRNTGPALGNIAYDRWNRQLFVSDLETGMIHRFSVDDGKDLGHYDHGARGRTSFTDAWSGKSLSLPPVPFDPGSAARIDSCAEGPFEKHPECWNYADFRRRIWGLAVRHDEKSNEVRLYYAIWGSDSFGNPAWDTAAEDRRNSVWSIRITKDGNFDTSSVTREFILSAFFTTDPAKGVLAGNSRPVSDIEFPDCGPQRVMLLAERGSARNLGLGKNDPFAWPHESRVLTYDLGADGLWRPSGRYDTGFYERQEHGVPRLRASSAGGCDFGFGYGQDWAIDSSRPNDFIWMTGDNLCSPQGPCFNPETRAFNDTSWVDGMQGTPRDLKKEVMPQAALNPPPSGPATPPEGPAESYMIDSDINVDQAGNPIDAGTDRSEATLIGDIDIYERCAVEVKRQVKEFAPPTFAAPEEPPPVHQRDMTHMRNASPMHNVHRSWHERNWSWHDRAQSYHYRHRSWHSRHRTWHWRNSSWHYRDQSWHWKEGSWHHRSQSWHGRQHSWHDRTRSWHSRNSSWHDTHRSWHNRNRSWHGRAESRGGDHHRNRSWHSRDRSWHSKAESRGGGDHHRNRSWHSRAESQGGHNRRLSLQDGGHNRKRSAEQGGGEHHNRRLSQQQGGGEHHNRKLSQQQGGGEHHNRRLSLQQGGESHNRKRSAEQGGGEHHNRRLSQQQGGGAHNRRLSAQQQGGETHNRRLSQQGGTSPSGEGGQHDRKLSSQQQGGGTTHNRRLSAQQQGGGTSHNRRLSAQQQGGAGESGGGGTTHNRRLSAQQQGGGTSHNRRLSAQQQGGAGESGGGGTQHDRRLSAQQQGGGTTHNRRLSAQQQGGGAVQPSGGGTHHDRRLSAQQQGGGGQTGGGGSRHNRSISAQQQGGAGQTGGGARHNRSISAQQQGGGAQQQGGGGSRHNRSVSAQQQGGGGGASAHNRNVSAQQQGGKKQPAGGAQHDRRTSAQQPRAR